ncbi:MAG: hypothetical protein CW338_06105 [Clostridiales bacterium]|nr:hypothetical protein [Clostridiales bacterium]
MRSCAAGDMCIVHHGRKPTEALYCDRYLDTMTVEATTARARQFPENTIIAKDRDKVVGFAVYGPSRDEDLPDAGEVIVIHVLSAYYNRKVGYRLMNEAVSRLSEYNTVLLWVFEKMREPSVFIRNTVLNWMDAKSNGGLAPRFQSSE